MSPSLLRRTRTRRLDRARGQGLVEFALVLPVLLLILVFAIDFGRTFFGYVIVNNAARIGANYAALHPTAAEGWSAATFEALIRNDTNVANCALASVPTPVYTDGDDAGTTNTDLGDRAQVGLSCTFRPLTPIVSAILGSTVTLSATADFPIRSGDIVGAVLPPPPPPPTTCTVPDLVGSNENAADDAWLAFGFSGAVTRVGNGNNWTIQDQSLDPDTSAACTSGITVYKTVTSNVPPTAVVSGPVSANTGDAVSFNGSGSSDPDGSIVNYTFTFGDGSPGQSGTSASASHAWTSPGTYTVTLTVTDDAGATDTDSLAVTVGGNEPPIANLVASPQTAGPAPLSVDFDASASGDPDGTIASYAWDFGDGSTASGATTSHQFDNTTGKPGNVKRFTVTLTVTDDQGATGTATITISVTRP